MTISRLVEIVDGTWVDPDDVRRIICDNGHEAVRGLFGRVIRSSTKPRVVVVFRDGSALEWVTDTSTAACDLADEIAGIVNGMTEPDGPDGEEFSEENTNLIPFRISA